MPTLKLTTWNIEWMIALFGGTWTQWDGTIPASFPGKSVGPAKLAAIPDVPALCRRIAGVIGRVKPKILAIQEGPPRTDQLELFVRDYLDDDFVVHSSNPKNQALHFLVHRSIAGKVTSYAHNSPETTPLRAKIPFYPWGTIEAHERKEHQFDRRPLVLTFTPSAGTTLRLINVHTKSKFSKLKTLKQWTDRNRVAVLDAIEVRQKLSAEIKRLREYVVGDLMLPVGGPEASIVLGDFNDGPLAGLMESEFLIHNILDEMVGSFTEPYHYFRHAMEPDVLATASTVTFSNPLQGGATVHELIDHILLSPEVWQAGTPFALRPGSCRVETAAFAAFDDSTSARRRPDRPSDHLPVSAVLEY